MRPRPLCAYLVVLVLLLASARAFAQQPNWTEKFPTSAPSPRSGQAMAYDAVRGEVVLFGGASGGALDDTWVWNGLTWTQKFPVNKPAARAGHVMAYDAARDEVVLFGGYKTSGYANDTWVWDGTNWTQRTPGTSPSARSVSAMIYDSARERVVLFGGYTGTSSLNDTWIWNGTTWTLQTPSIKPPLRHAHALAFDPVAGLAVLFGGVSSTSGTLLNDTWVWGGTTWVQESPAAKPPVRMNHAMAYSAASGGVVLFGGGDNPNFFDDTWLWTGTNWILKNPWDAPAARWGHSMAYDPLAAQVLLFGGNRYAYETGTWVWAEAPCALSGKTRGPSQGTVGKTLGFTASITSACGRSALYDWEFGDGAHEYTASAVHAYMIPGTYYWSLTVWTLQGDMFTASGSVIVKPSLQFLTILSPQAKDAAFPVTLVTRDGYGTLLPISGSLTLTSTVGKVSPATVTLVAGMATASVKVYSSGDGVRLNASGVDLAAVSNGFDVKGSTSTTSLLGFVGNTYGLPVSGATVRAGTYTDTTNALGYYRIDGLPCGTFNVQATKDSQASALDAVTVTCERPGLHNFRMVATVCDNARGLTPVVLVPGIMGSSSVDKATLGRYPGLPFGSSPDWDYRHWGSERSRIWGLADPKPDKLAEWLSGKQIPNVGWRDLISDFEKRGYEVGCTLFPSPYDWRDPVPDAVDAFLEDTIDHALAWSGAPSHKVQIVAHSMGGLLARDYVSRYGAANVDKIALVGTPHLGAPKAYYLWEEGNPDPLGKPGETSSAEIVLKELMNDDPSNPDQDALGIRAFVRKHVTSVKGLLPTYSFLEVQKSGDLKGLIDGNAWLRELNLKSKVVGCTGGLCIDTAAVKAFIGSTRETIGVIQVLRPTSMYEDGKPTTVDYLIGGDETVPVKSATYDSVLEDSAATSSAEHAGLIKQFIADIATFLGAPAASAPTLMEAEAPTNMLGISLSGPAVFSVTDGSSNRAGVDPLTLQPLTEIANADLDIGVDSESVLLTGPADGNYIIRIGSPSTSADYRLSIAYVGADGVLVEHELRGFASPAGPIAVVTVNLHAGTSPAITVARSPAPPTNVAASLNTATGRARLSWTASTTAGALYRVYSRQRASPYFALAGTASGLLFDTAEPWAGDAATAPTDYAVVAVLGDGSESFFSPIVRNNDRDHDGLADADEIAFGSDPTKPDTDGDGVGDRTEWEYGTSPDSSDTDGDGLSDLIEITVGSDPGDPDVTTGPAPQIFAVTPLSLPAGTSATVTVTGGGFFKGVSVIRWKGSARATTYVDAHTLRVTLSAADLATPGSFILTVLNPAPGGGSSPPITIVVYEVRPPDLVVSALTTAPTKTAGAAGQTITFTATTKNSGGGATTAAVVTKLYLSSDSTLTASDVLLGTFSPAVPIGFAAGATSVSNPLVVRIPEGTLTRKWYFIAKTDADLAQAESSETNNTKNKAISVGPDLYISKLARTPTSVAAGATVNITVWTKDYVGAAPAGASTTKVYYSTDGVTLTQLLVTRAVGPLPGGGEDRPAAFAVTIPPTAITGTRYLVAVADADGAVAESQEGTKNRKKVSLTIK